MKAAQRASCPFLPWKDVAANALEPIDDALQCFLGSFTAGLPQQWDRLMLVWHVSLSISPEKTPLQRQPQASHMPSVAATDSGSN
jgi:hypothetical protein